MNKNFQILALLKSDDLSASLYSTLSDTQGVGLEVRIGDFQSIAPRLVNGSAPDLLLVDMSSEELGALPELSQIISRKYGQMAVVATAKDADLNDIRSLMRIGVADFIPQPFNKQDVQNAVAAVRGKLGASHHTGGAVLSFIASCGGVGATTLAIQTAADLMVKSKKERNRVCLIDLDLQMGNIALSLDIHTDVGLQTIIENPERLDDEFLAGAISHHKSGIDVLKAPTAILPLEIMTDELAQHLLSWARRHYDHVVVDMPLNWASWTASVLQASDMIMLVTEISVSGVQRCQRQFNLLVDQQLDDIPLAVIANRFRSGFGAKNAAKQAETALGRKINCFVRADSDAANAAREQGVLLSEVKRGSRIEKDIRNFLIKVRPALVSVRDAGATQISVH